MATWKYSLRQHKTTAERGRTPFSILFSCLLVTLFVAAGCGIETSPYLLPPEDITEPSTAGQKIFTFSHNTKNSIDYVEGYEIYYKFYHIDQKSQIEIEAEEMEDTEGDLDDLTGYRRLYGTDVDPAVRPLIDLETAEKSLEFEITIDFNSVSDSLTPYAVISYVFEDTSVTKESQTAARYVINIEENENEESFYGFYEYDLNSNFADFSSSLVDDTDEVYLSLYVATFGRQDVFNTFHSRPAFLGYITLTTDRRVS